MPNLELRKVTFNSRLSEETNAYTADLWVDARLLCHVSNHGQGGCDSQFPAKGRTRSEIDALNALIKSTYPKRPYDFGGKAKGEMEQDLETVCGDLLAEFLAARDLKRLLKRTVAFVDPKGHVRSYKGKIEEARRSLLVAETLRKYPGAKVLNTLPFADALTAYRASAS